jgi:hypothetical protein
MRIVFLFASIAAFAAADQTGGLTRAEADILIGKLAAQEAELAAQDAIISALNQQLRPIERRSQSGGPSVSAVAGDIVQSVNAGNKAVIKVAGEDAFTFSTAANAFEVLGHTTQTIGGGSIKVRVYFLFPAVERCNDIAEKTKET